MEISLFLNKNKKKDRKEKLKMPKGKFIGFFGIELSCLDNKKIDFVDSHDIKFHTSSVKSEINFYCKLNQIKDKTFKEKLEDDMQKLELDLLKGQRKISTLSDSEKFLFYLLLKIEFLSNDLIINDLFKYLDRNNKKRIVSFIKEELLNQHSIIILDSDINILYNYTDYIFIFKDANILVEGETKKILTDVEYLINNHLDVPYLPLLTYQAKIKKGIKLFYHQDIRDIMKDIYKHV